MTNAIKMLLQRQSGFLKLESTETVEVVFFVTGLETLNVGSFEAFLTIYLPIITRNI
jgi:hypothetical protein